MEAIVGNRFSFFMPLLTEDGISLTVEDDLKDSEAFKTCKEAFKGLSYKEAEKILWGLMSDIKTSSKIL